MRAIAANVQNSTFSIPYSLSSVEFWSTGYYDPGQLQYVQVAKTPTYPVVCRFPLFIALYDHSPPALQTDRQPDGQTSCSKHKRNMHVCEMQKKTQDSRVTNLRIFFVELSFVFFESATLTT